MDAKTGNQEKSRVTGKFSVIIKYETGKRLTEFCTGHSKHPLLTTQDMSLWTSPDGQYPNQINCILCNQRWRSSIQSVKTRPGADCGSNHEFHVAKFRLQLQKVGQITRPFRYDLNQILYDYTVEVTNSVKGLDLIDNV